MPARHPFRALATVAAAALALIVPATASAAGVVTEPIAQSPGEIRDYWTPERMRAAESVEPPASPGPASVEAPASSAALPPDLETDPALDTSFPQRVHGRLFVVLGGQNASCSASVVSSEDEDLIVTAGHCLVIPGELSGGAGIVFADSAMFVPAYRNGAAPFGSFVGTRMATPRAFAQIGDISFDFGAVKLAPGAAGKVETAIGARGIAFNRKPQTFRNDAFEIYGYPARPQPDYDGERLILCVAQFQGFERFTSAPVIGPCNQQEGSSGAGWVRNGRVESVTSHAGCATPTGCSLISGSYLGDEEFDVYRNLGGISKGKRKRLKSCKRHDSKSKRRSCRGRVQRFAPSGG
jgi:hypothetical protein